MIVKLQKVLSHGHTVDNLDRARIFTLKFSHGYLGRVGGNPNNPDSFPIHGVAAKASTVSAAATTTYTLRTTQAHRTGRARMKRIFHQRSDMAWRITTTLKTAERIGAGFHRRSNATAGHTIYMFDSEGNYWNCIFPPGGRRARQAN